jgi:serine/threonine protein phosphatase PrpC
MRFKIGARTDVGRVREGNEDSYMVHEPLFAVADGMGGHQGGEVASNLALRSLEPLAEEPPPDGDKAPRLAEGVREANRTVLKKASGDPSLSGMGTTLTVVLAGQGSRIHLAHVGDSRAYLLRGNEFTQLTRDQTVVQRLVDEGRITAEEAEIHPQRSILTNALGVDREILVDEASYELTMGDRLLLCSDGLSGMVPEEEIHRILVEHEDPQEACDVLVQAANEAGGQDNITAVILDAVEDDQVDAAPAVALPPTLARDAPTAEHAAPKPAEDTAPVAPASVPSSVQAGEADYTQPAQPVPSEAPAEREPYGFAAAGRRRRPWLRRLAWILGALIVIAGALFAVKRFFIENQWFVGVSEGQVAIFSGIPAEPLGIQLSTLEQETDLAAGDVSRFSAWENLEDGITADSREDADSIVEQMRQDLERQARERERQQQGQGQQPGGGGQGQ